MLKSFLNFNFNSIKRLFLAYSIVTFILLGGVLFWLMGKAYASYMETKKLEMEYAISKVELSFLSTLNYSESVISHIAKQIEVSDGSTKQISEILKSFSDKASIGEGSIKDDLSITMFSWINEDKLVTINSEFGKLSSPYSVAKRRYLQPSIENSWELKIGSPEIGMLSAQQIIPAAFGVTNLKTKKYLGTIVVGFAIDRVSDNLKKIVNNRDLDFTILNKNGEVILESTVGIFSEDTSFLKNVTASKIKRNATISSFSPFKLDESYLIAKSTNKNSYLIIAGYENSVLLKGLLSILWPYILAFSVLSLIFFRMWYALKLQVIAPIVQLSNVSRLVAQDRDQEVIMPKSNIAEIMELTNQLGLIERYKINLLQAKKSQERFFANMSHELRTPLNGILNFSFMMQKEMFGSLNEDYKEMASDIHSSGSHLLNLVNDILDFSKMDIGKMKLSEEEFDLEEEVKMALKIVLSDPERYGDNSAIKVISQVEAKDLKLKGDRRMFKQILLNLLSNASKFVDVGSITLRLFLDANKNLILEIKDTGIGIKEEDLAKLTIEFGQVGDGYYRGKKQGTGLGLFLVKKMTELHQGKLEISSVYGEGTTAKVVFPKERVVITKGEANDPR